MATTAQSLLALYGALDQAVTSTGDSDIEATVERYLPGTTGENAGWYDQLLGFLADPAYRLPYMEVEPPGVPDLGEALTTLRERHEITDESLTPVQLSRMVYAIGALSHLPSYYPPEEWDEQFAETLGLAAPSGGGETLALLRSEFHSRDGWSSVAQNAARRGLIDSDVAVVPLCRTKAKWVRNHLCVVLTTEFETQHVSLDQLKNVVDPLNWDNCLPFFCEMDAEPARVDGWSRVLEHVSTTCSIPGTPELVTPLKYWKGPANGTTLPQPSAWVDYELDDDPAPGEKGDGRMVVDEGFIRMTSTVGDSAKRGVRVRTRKVAGFRNLAWVPAAIFACVMGYADQGVTMLLGGVAKRPPNGSPDWTDWAPSTVPTTQSGTGSTQSTGTYDGADPSRRAVEVAVDMLNDCIDDMSAKSAAIATNWATGAAPIAETMTFTADLAARLATDPWRYLERLRDANGGSGK
ncbi:MAG: hypothetical protein ACXVX7_10930 [Mycobacterium sp.]